MSNYLLRLILVAMVALAGSARAQNCHNGEDRAVVLIFNIRLLMVRPALSYWNVHWQASDTTTLRPVTTDSLCALALRTIQSSMNTDHAPKGITLIYTGNYFVAQQVERTGSEWTNRYILDATLTHVLQPCPNGYNVPPNGECPARKP